MPISGQCPVFSQRRWFAILIMLGSLCLHESKNLSRADETPPVADKTSRQSTAGEETKKSTAKPARNSARKHVPLVLDQSDAAIEKRLQDDVTYLASEELEGRGVRTKGLELAAEHIAASFQQSGLVTDWYGGKPYHEFRLFSSQQRGIVEKTEIALTGEETPRKFTKDQDFTSLSFSSQGTFSHPLIFAGYGITAKDIGYDDYAGIDVKGKAVLVLRHEPRRFDTDSPFNGVENSPHAYLQSKMKNAIAHGAAAMIICTDHAERLAPETEGDAKPEEIDALLRAQLTGAGAGSNIPVIHLKRTLAEKLIRDSLKEDLVDREKRIDQELKPLSCELPGLTWNGQVVISRPHRKLRNVVASLEGAGEEAEQTIIIGAHYDHLGRDSWGSLGADSADEIHHGADDNASGTAVVMEVARQLAARPTPLKHRVLFMTFSAEELGLIGSSRYVQDPLFPLSETIAMLNLDMVGRLREGKLTIYGLETGENWKSLIASGIAASPDGNEFKLSLRSGGYGPSDHASFFEKGVPVLHFFTGFHPQYHRPSDVASLINVQGMRQIASLVTAMVVKLGNDEVVVKRSTSRSSDLLADDLSELEMELDDASPPPVRLGVRVATENNSNGVIVRAILPGSLAERNGIREGDVILRVDGQAVKSALDIRTVLQEKRTAPSWKIGVKRGEVDSEIIVKQAP